MNCSLDYHLRISFSIRSSDVGDQGMVPREPATITLQSRGGIQWRLSGVVGPWGRMWWSVQRAWRDGSCTLGMWQAMQPVLRLTGHNFPWTVTGISADRALAPAGAASSVGGVPEWQRKHFASYGAVCVSSHDEGRGRWCRRSCLGLR